MCGRFLALIEISCVEGISVRKGGTISGAQISLSLEWGNDIELNTRQKDLYFKTRQLIFYEVFNCVSLYYYYLDKRLLLHFEKYFMGEKKVITLMCQTFEVDGYNRS